MAARAHGSDSYRRHLVRISRTSPGFTAGLDALGGCAGPQLGGRVLRRCCLRNSRGRSTFAMISVNCVAERDRGQGIASAFDTPIHRGCNGRVVADCLRVPSGSRRGERAGASLAARL